MAIFCSSNQFMANKLLEYFVTCSFGAYWYLASNKVKDSFLPKIQIYRSALKYKSVYAFELTLKIENTPSTWSWVLRGVQKVVVRWWLVARAKKFSALKLSRLRRNMIAKQLNSYFLALKHRYVLQCTWLDRGWHLLCRIYKVVSHLWGPSAIRGMTEVLECPRRGVFDRF